MFRLSSTVVTVCFAVMASGSLAMAQQGNLYFGVGTAMDSTNGQAIDAFGTGNFLNTPRMTGLFLDLGGEFMLTNHLGAGAEVNWRASQGNYSGLNYRPIFYDFNGIWQPFHSKRIVPEIQAGLGGVDMSFNVNQSYCDQFVGCSTFNAGSESSNHFQVHLGVGLRIYATEHVFIRPAVDAHWVNNFFQFGSDWVPEYSVSIGYSLGGNQ